MNKQELVLSMAKEANCTQKDAEKLLNAFVASVTNALGSGDKVQLVGFGTFEVRLRKAREGHNIKTGQKIHIPASKTAAFKAGKSLQDAVK